MNREYKSDVFSMLLEDPARALDVYNALNHTNYEDPGEIQVTKLDSGVSLSLRNDASFIIDMNISLYEHQSTYNPNMALRSLIYLVHILEKWIKKNKIDLYSRNEIKIPVPRFAVFYNGTDKRPERQRMKLSDMFDKPCENPEVEVICDVYNINSGYNEELKKSSPTLREYMDFVDKVCYYKSVTDGSNDAVEMAIDDCIKAGVLVEFLTERRNEVIKVAELDFTWETREELIRLEERRLGKNEGRIEGRNEGSVAKLITQVRKKVSKNKPIEQIADELECEVSEIEQIYRLITENPDTSDEQIINIIVN